MGGRRSQRALKEDGLGSITIVKLTALLRINKFFKAVSMRHRLLQMINDGADEQIQTLFHYARHLFVDPRQSKRKSILSLGPDLIHILTEYLTPRDLRSLSETSNGIRDCVQRGWMQLGLVHFDGILIHGMSFTEIVAQGVSPHDAFNLFESSWGFQPSEMCNQPIPSILQSAVTGRMACFTVPTLFGVSPSARLFIDITAEMHFGPDVVRSVVGVVDSLDPIDCDRALSFDHWGLAFGPLSGIISSRGKYFDRYDTFNTGPFIRDFLAAAMVDTVGIRIGIFFDRGSVSFYRLPEEKANWECTGVVYKARPDQKVLYPAVMFWRLSPSESVTFKLEGLHDNPPFEPHDNFLSQDMGNWANFDEAQHLDEEDEDFDDEILPATPVSSPRAFRE